MHVRQCPWAPFAKATALSRPKRGMLYCRDMGMTYRIDLYDEGRALIGRRYYAFRNDNRVINFAGKIIHPHVIRIWQGDRLVIELPSDERRGRRDRSK